jgi:hypothetical protein
MTSWCRCPGTPRQRQEQHRSLTVTYTYDALGHRVSERKLEAPGAMLSKSFLHDGEHVAAEAQTNASDALAEPRRYTRTDDDDDLAAITRSARNGAGSPTAKATGEDAPSAASIGRCLTAA